MKRVLSIAAVSLISVTPAFSQDEKKSADSDKSIYDVPVLAMRKDGGSTTTLARYKGDVILLVNVASKCGLTPQYEALEALHRKYGPRGFTVVGFPSNDFRGQEPGTEEQIVEFCRANYDVTFPLYAKVHTKGSGQAPIYTYLTGPGSRFPGEIQWNFEKFIIGRDGKVQARLDPKQKPDSPEVIEAIETALEQ